MWRPIKNIVNSCVRHETWILPVAALLQLVSFSYFLWETMIRTPFQDMLAWIVSYLYFKDHGDFGAYLWGLHNEHRLVWVRLLTIIDVELFHAAGLAFIVAGTASLLASAVIAFLFIRRALRDSGSTSQAAWLAPMLILTSASAVDCAIPINTVYPIALFFMIGSVALFEGGTDGRRALALPVAAAAAFGNGAGLVIWPVLVWAAWRQKAGLIWVVTVALLGGLFIGLYTHGTPSTTPLATALQADQFTRDNASRMVSYALTYLALPFSRAPSLATVSHVIGLVLLAASLFAIARVSLIERANTRLNRFDSALILIALGSAAVAAIGRSHLDPDVRVPVRYTVLVAPMHIGLLCLAIQCLGRRARSASGWIVVSSFAAALLAMQVLIGRPGIRVSNEMRLAIHAYYLGNRDPDVVRFVYTDAASAETLTSLIRDRGLLGPD
jgi:hypothetical protein